MPNDATTQLIIDQIGHEFAAHQQYVACAVYYDDETLPQLASFFYRQALEERDHAMMLIRYLLDTESAWDIPGVAAPKSDFADVVEPVTLALEQEKRVSVQINAIAAAARADNDFTTEQFIQWFIKEQIEEIATMSDLVTVAARYRDDVAKIEDYVAREQSGGEDTDPTAPRPAGA